MDEEKLARTATAGDEALLLTSKFTHRIHTELFRVPTYTHVNAGSTWTCMEIEFVSSLALVCLNLLERGMPFPP